MWTHFILSHFRIFQRGQGQVRHGCNSRSRVFGSSDLLRVVGRFMLIGVLGLHAVAQKATLLWTVDLKTNADFENRLKQTPIALRPPTVEFLNDKQIIVAFNDGVISSMGPTLRPFGFHVLQIGAGSGDIGKELSFPVVTDYSRASVISNSRLLILAGEEVRQYSSEFLSLLSFQTPLRLHGQPTPQVIGGKTFWNPRYESWQMDVAPGGKTVLLSHTKRPMQMEFLWLRTDDLSETHRAETPQTWTHIFAGDESALLIEPMKSMLLSNGNLRSVCGDCFMAHFISDDLLFLDKQKHFEIVDMSGRTLVRGDLSIYAVPFVRSLNATRLAYSTGSYQGHGFPLVTHYPRVHTDVRVFDWKNMSQVGQVSLDKEVGPISAGFAQIAIALSPDGRQLVILDDANLSCYRLQ